MEAGGGRRQTHDKKHTASQTGTTTHSKAEGTAHQDSKRMKAEAEEHMSPWAHQKCCFIHGKVDEMMLKRTPPNADAGPHLGQGHSLGLHLALHLPQLQGRTVRPHTSSPLLRSAPKRNGPPPATCPGDWEQHQSRVRGQLAEATQQSTILRAEGGSNLRSDQ